MQTLRTCSLSDDYKHVCFKDLEAYIPIDGFLDVLKGYSDLEIEKIRQELGIPSPIHVDQDLNMYSRNPVENRAIFEALASKADVDKLARVAITGYYKDLKGVPCELPNPQSLIIKNIDGTYINYDGSEPVTLKFPQSVKEFKDYGEYIVDYTKIESMIPVKQISINGILQEPTTESKIVNINTVTDEQLNSTLKKYALSSEVITYINRLNVALDLANKEIQNLTLQLGKLEQRVKVLENK